MPDRASRNTKGKIITAAWKLFYEQGYENTTVDAIIAQAKTSKGSFYHYFRGKDALLGTLAYLFDEKYEELMETMDPALGSFEKLLFLNNELFTMIENGISLDLLARLFSSQLITKGEKSLLDRSRLYYRLLAKIIQEGQKNKELRSDISVGEIVKAYAICERALMYDWCICNGDYSLKSYAERTMPMLLAAFQKK